MSELLYSMLYSIVHMRILEVSRYLFRILRAIVQHDQIALQFFMLLPGKNDKGILSVESEFC